jgi:hypothetical protein
VARSQGFDTVATAFDLVVMTTIPFAQWT